MQYKNSRLLIQNRMFLHNRISSENDNKYLRIFTFNSI